MFLGTDKLDGQFDFPLFYHLSRVFLLKSQTVIDFKIFVEQNDLRYQNSYYSNALMSNFIGNHDIARAISVANGDFDGSPQGGSIAHDRAWSNEPTIPNLEEPYKRLRMAQTFLLTSTGIPLIYQGDEFGMPGAHDPDNRRMMRFGNELSAFETNTKNHLQKLGVFRKNNPATRKGSRETCEVDNDTWLYKMSFGTNTVMVGFNRNNIEVTKSCSGVSGVFKNLDATDVQVTNGSVTIPAMGVVVLGKN
jgi:glycosidase